MHGKLILRDLEDVQFICERYVEPRRGEIVYDMMLAYIYYIHVYLDSVARAYIYVFLFDKT